MGKYAIGIDYGSKSSRLILVDVSNGQEIAEHVMEYKHSAFCERLQVTPDMVLHHPLDYLDTIYVGIPRLIQNSSVSPTEIISIGIDSTTSTVLAVDAHGVPMCFRDKYANCPNAYIKLWKDHTAMCEAARINEILEKENLGSRKMSSEWLLPKAFYILNNDPELYEEMERFIEVSDWLVWILTGNEKCSRSQAGFTGLWTPDKGYIERSILNKINTDLKDFVDKKLLPDLHSPFERAGYLAYKEAKKLGLGTHVAVSISNIDAIAAFPASGITGPGKMVSVIGTSSCHMLQSKSDMNIPNSMKVKNSIFPGYYTYISSQVAVGDCFNWFFENIIPYQYYVEARSKNKDIHCYMEEKLSTVPQREKCIALDWWNGLRKNSQLKGIIWGLDINTKPEDIYLSLIESTAFGLKLIIEGYEKHNIKVDEICAAGGVAYNSSVILQIYANIIKKPIKVSRSKHASAFGMAIFSSVAAGKENGGYDNMFEATAKMGGVQEISYYPQKEYFKLYDQIYKKYKKLYDYFANLDNNVL